MVRGGRKVSRRLWLWLLLSFIAGGIVGGALVTAGMHEQRRRMYGNSKATTDSLVADLQSKLALSEEQVVNVRAAVERHQTRVRAAFAQVRPEMAAAIDNLEEDVAALLTADQLPQWRTQCEKMRRWARVGPGTSGQAAPAASQAAEAPGSSEQAGSPNAQ